MSDRKSRAEAKIPGPDTGITVHHTLCDICTGLHCGLDVYVRDGKVIKVEGTQNHPFNEGKLCTKGASNRQYLYRENRIRTPLRRVGARGEGRLEPISWEEAYDEIVGRLNALKRDFGPECVAWYSGYGKWFRPWLHRLTHSFGSLNYGTEASTCHAATLMAWKTVCGRPFGSDIAHNDDLYIGWACNAMISDYPIARALVRFRERGGTVVTIDTRDTVTGQKLSDLHLKIHPGTDGALAWGLANVMIENGWYDKDFVERYADGFAEYRAYSRQFPPERTEAITGIPRERIIALAKRYGQAKKVCIYTPSAAIAHNRNGYNSMRAIICLQVLTGNIDRAGTQLPSYPGWLSCSCGFQTRQAQFENSTRPVGCKKRISQGQFPVWDALMDEFQLASLPDQIETAEPYPVKALVGFGMNHRIGADPERLLAALQKLDFFVDTDVILSSTAKYADIILPVCTSLERSELKAYGGGYLTCTSPCVSPLFESKPDTEIICELSRRLGLDDPILNAGYEQTLQYLIGDLSVSLSELREAELPIRLQEYRPYEPGTLLRSGFETPSGKLELSSRLIEAVRGERTDLDPLPVWTSGLDGADAELYPMTLIAGSRIPNAIHSRLHECMPWPRSLRPRPAADIHPADAKRLGIRSGDRIRLRTALGAIEVEAHLTAAGAPGDVYLFHGYPEADVNHLIPSSHLDPYSGFPGFNQLRCAVEKAGEA